MDQLLHNTYFLTIANFMVAGLAITVFLAIFELVTRYKTWKEIKEGNLAVALAIGGKIFGIANIFRFSISHNDTVWQALIWGSFGYVLLLFAYFIFEFLTPGFNVDKELEKGNLAVGLLSFIISVGFSYIIGASIS